MRKNKKLIIIAVAALAVILTIGIIGGAALAQDADSPSGTTPGKTLLGKIAAKLGIEQQQLEEAITEAQKEMREEALDARLNKLVEQGKITEEQAQEYKQWQESRPDVPKGLDLIPRGPKGRFGLGGFRCFPGQGELPATTAPSSITLN